MRLNKLFLVAALVFGSAQAAAAQTQTFRFLSGGTVTAYGYYVGPYQGATGDNFTKRITLNCVDFFHHISLGQVWNANITNLGVGDLSNTRFGAMFANAATLYRQAAYLTTQYAGKTNAQIAQIQATIWRLFDNNPTVDPPNPGTSYWLNLARANYTSIDANRIMIITDVNARYASGFDNPNSAQEFVTYNVTPEPISMMLLGTGLAGVAAARRRKKKQNEDRSLV
jgi:hypothetical protein